MELWLIGYFIYLGFISKEKSPWWFYPTMLIFWPLMVGMWLREFADSHRETK